MLTSLLLFLCAGAMTPQQTRALAERYNKAQAFVQQRDYQKAAGVLNALVRDYGGSEFGDELRFAMAEVSYNQGQFAHAADLFNQLLEKPQFSYMQPEAMYGLAISSIMLGNYKQAQLTLEKLSKQPGYDRDDRASFAMGVLYYFQKDYEQSIARLDNLAIPEAKYYAAKAYAQVGKPLPALLRFKQVTDDAPNTPLATMAHFAAGQALFINRDYDGAQAKFQYFVDNFPESQLADYANYFLGCALLAQKQYAQAIDRLTPLTRHRNNLMAAHANYFVGYADLAMGQAQQAVERFQRVRANYPKTKAASYANMQLAEAMLATADTAQTLLATSQLTTMFKTGDLSGVGNYLSGVINYQVGEYGKAADQLEAVLVQYASTSLREPACAMLLLTLNSSGQYEKSTALGSRYVADFPGDTTSWRAKTLYFLADGYYYDKKYSEAEAQYQRAYAHTGSSDIAVYARLGRNYCLYHLGRLNEAANGFKGLLAARTTDTLFTISAYLGYGYALFNQKEFLKALDVFEPLAKTFPDKGVAAIPAYFYTGYAYYQLNYFGQAVDAWTVLINRFPDKNTKAPEAAFRAGDTYFKALEYDKAISVFNFVIERYPFSDFGPASQALIAQCYYNRKQHSDAVREYQKFLDLYSSDPQVPSVRKSLESSYFLAGQEDSLTMEEFLRRFPQSELAAEGQFKKGQSLFDAGNFEQAIQELQKAVVNFPGAPVAGDAQLLTAEAYSQLKRWPDAAQSYQKYLDYFPAGEQRAGAVFNMATAYFNSGDYKLSIKNYQLVVDSFPDSEYSESAKKNVEASRKRLGAAEGDEQGEAPPGSQTPVETPPAEGAPVPPTEGENQP